MLELLSKLKINHPNIPATPSAAKFLNVRNQKMVLKAKALDFTTPETYMIYLVKSYRQEPIGTGHMLLISVSCQLSMIQHANFYP